jgi:hypothetical protein
MSWWNRIMSFLRREAADVKEGLEQVGETLDAELARKERELAASPEERIDMILEEQAVEDQRFEDLTDRILGRDDYAEGGGESTPPA